MELAIRIGIEVILAPVLLFFAVWFWQAIHRGRYVKRMARDQKLLDELVQTVNSEEPFSERTEALEPVNGDWAYNMLLITKSDLQAVGMLRNFSLVVCVAILIGSFFLGIVYLVINVVLFLLMALTGVSATVQNGAAGQILSMAQIMYRWKRADPERYAEFLREAVGVHELDSSLERYAT